MSASTFRGTFQSLRWYLLLPFTSLTRLDSYRSYGTEHKTKMPEGFIDGDLVERFLDLPQAQMEDVCKGIKVLNKSSCPQ